MGYTLNYEVQRKENETTITIHVNNEAYNQSQKGSLQRYQVVPGCAIAHAPSLYQFLKCEYLDMTCGDGRNISGAHNNEEGA